MKTGASQAANDTDLFQSQKEPSLFAGGPFFQLLHWAQLHERLTRSRPNFLIVIPLLVWLPLLALSAMQGQLFRGDVAIPFALDLEVHVRFLAALPLLLAAELVAAQRMRPLLQTFLDRNLIPQNAMTQFDESIKSAFRLRDSVLAEILLIAFVYGVGILVIWRHLVVPDAATWYVTSPAEGSKLSLAGMWYGYVSLPVFQFVLCRWYFRLFIWARFLWQVSRIDLNLVPTHPDRAGGLGFLAEMTAALAVFAMAHGVLLSGWLATRVVVLGVPLTEFKEEIAAMVIFVLCVTLGPLLVFWAQMRRTRRLGLRDYGTLAMRYVREFDAKWLRGGMRGEEPLIGSSDIQSLADLGNSFNLVRTMRRTPITWELVVRFGLATLLPVAPLLLTMIPLEELVKKLLKILF